MRKTIKKILLIGVIAIMGLGVFGLSGCNNDPEFALDVVSVSIRAEFRDKFLAEEFTVEDFEWDNIEKIVYNVWHSNLDPQRGWLTIHLIEHGKEQVDSAIKHFETLDFVRSAGRDYIIELIRPV